MADQIDHLDQNASRELLERVWADAVPHNAALGLDIVGCGKGWASMRLRYRPELVGNPDTGVLHGGAVTALLDATSGAAVFLRLPEPMRIATLDLRIDYLRPAAPGQDVVARAECYRLTRSVAFVRAMAFHDDDSDPIAAAAGTFMVFGPIATTEERGP
jgi:uncharacterized protein (TIGR00369 family)